MVGRLLWRPVINAMQSRALGRRSGGADSCCDCGRVHDWPGGERSHSGISGRGQFVRDPVNSNRTNFIFDLTKRPLRRWN